MIIILMMLLCDDVISLTSLQFYTNVYEHIKYYIIRNKSKLFLKLF